MLQSVVYTLRGIRFMSDISLVALAFYIRALLKYWKKWVKIFATTSGHTLGRGGYFSLQPQRLLSLLYHICMR